MDRINRNYESRIMNKVYLAVCGIGISLILNSLFFIPPAYAARLFFETEVTEVGVGQEMEIVLYLDSEGEAINALEGTVQVPGLLSLETLRDGNTLISFWAERPEVNENQEIVFAGVIPGGWQGNRGRIFSFIAQTESQGSGKFTLSNTQVLLHDGKGTQATLNTEPLTLNIDETIKLTPFVIDLEDREPPEPFTPLLAQDPDIFEGDYFLVFSAQDKASGIAMYEVQETKERLKDERGGNWRVAESPYRIVDQTLRSLVYIRAIDKAGNIRVEVFEPPLFDVRITPTRERAPLIFLIFAILLGIILAIVIAIGWSSFRRFWKNRTRNK